MLISLIVAGDSVLEKLWYFHGLLLKKFGGYDPLCCCFSWRGFIGAHILIGANSWCFAGNLLFSNKERGALVILHVKKSGWGDSNCPVW